MRTTPKHILCELKRGTMSVVSDTEPVISDKEFWARSNDPENIAKFATENWWEGCDFTQLRERVHSLMHSCTCAGKTETHDSIMPILGATIAFQIDQILVWLDYDLCNVNSLLPYSLEPNVYDCIGASRARLLGFVRATAAFAKVTNVQIRHHIINLYESHLDKLEKYTGKGDDGKPRRIIVEMRDRLKKLKEE